MKRLSFVPVMTAGRYHERVREARRWSGVYVIRRRDNHRVQYVGESHTGRLYDTATRHFREWSGPTAGYTANPDAMEIAILRVPAPSAVSCQNGLIRRLRPHWNVEGTPRPSEETTMHLDAQTIGTIASGILGLAGLVLHFTPSFTVAGRIATWLEQNGPALTSAAESIAKATQPPAAKK